MVKADPLVTRASMLVAFPSSNASMSKICLKLSWCGSPAWVMLLVQCSSGWKGQPPDLLCGSLRRHGRPSSCCSAKVTSPKVSSKVSALSLPHHQTLASFITRLTYSCLYYENSFVLVLVLIPHSDLVVSVSLSPFATVSLPLLSYAEVFLSLTPVHSSAQVFC